MVLHRDGPTRRDEPAASSSVPDIGRTLRRERTRQGLRLDEMATRTGIPEEQLEALEAGTVDRLDDRVSTVQALRTYADSLGLPGGDLALSLVEHWPAGGPRAVAVPLGDTAHVTADPVPAAPVPVAPLANTFGDTGVVPIGTPTESGSGTVTVSPAGSTVRRVGGTSPARDPGTAQVPVVFADTGVTPAVPVERRRRGAPLALKVVVSVVALALAVGVAGLVIHQVRPRWLSDIGVTSPPRTASTHRVTHHAVVPIVAMTHQSNLDASFDVHAGYFLLEVVPVGGESWVKVTDPQHVNPQYEGTLVSGQVKDFLVAPGQSLTVQVGSPHARVFVSVAGKEAGFYFPTVAPFTMYFHSVS